MAELGPLDFSTKDLQDATHGGVKLPRLGGRASSHQGSGGGRGGGGG